MIHQRVIDLANCSDFRRTMAARPPLAVHATAALLTLLLGILIAWAALVRANVVVKAQGRVRSADQPAKVFTQPAQFLDGRVAAVFVKVGDVVSEGQVLLTLDTARLDNEIAVLERQIAADDEGVANMEQIRVLLADQFATAIARAEAELRQSEEELRRARRQRDSQIRTAEAALQEANEDFERHRRLLNFHATSQADHRSAELKAQRAHEQLEQARLPVNKGRTDVLRRQLDNVHKEFAVRQAELTAQRSAKQGRIDAARKKLENLFMERQRSVLKAPSAGVVVAGRIKAGEILPLGTPAFEIAPQEGLQFVAAVPHEDIAQIRHGMSVDIKFDAFDYQEYGTVSGTVSFVAPDSSENVDVPGAAMGILYEVRVALTDQRGVERERRVDLKLGLGGVAEIVIERESILRLLLRRARGAISLG